MKTIKYITYPIVVIESVWPKLPEEAPKIVGPDGSASNIFKTAGDTGEYSGYYKIIPLNVLSVSTQSSLDGHQFNISFDASYVYIELDPNNSALPPKLLADIRLAALNVDAADLHVLVGVLGTLSPQQLGAANIEAHIVPFDTVATLVDELDTVTVYQISEEDLFDFESLLRLGGGSFSRITPNNANDNIKAARKVGLPETKPRLETINDKVLSLRSFLSGIGILTYFDLAGRATYPYDLTSTNYIESARRLQLDALSKYFDKGGSFEELLQFFPEIVAKKLASGAISRNEITAELNNYYASNSKLTYLLPFGFYKAIDITLLEVFGSSDDTRTVAMTAAIDAILAKYNPSLFSKIREDYLEPNNISHAIEFVNSLKIPKTVIVDDYLVGLNRFSDILEEFYGKLANTTKNQLYDVTINDVLEIPISSETPFTVLKGHITNVSSSASVNGDTFSKTITLSGEGLELPLKRHTVFFDTASANRLFLQLPTQLSVINSTPIEAAKHIIDTFMPEYVKVEELSRNDKHEAAQGLRDFSVFVEDYGKKVSKGALIIPDILQNTPDTYIFAPISYVSTDYLSNIQSAFDEVAIYERKGQIIDQAPEGPVANVLDEFLGKSSIYNWHVDEFGYLRVRFELGQAVVPTDTVLSPYITDITISSISTALDESRIYTDVEVVPKGYSFTSPSEGNIMGLFGRAVPPSIAEENNSFQKLELPKSTEKLADIGNWISGVLYDFEKIVLRAIKLAQKDGALAGVHISTAFNQTTPEELLDKLQTIGVSTSYQQAIKIFNPSELANIYVNNGAALDYLLAFASAGTDRPFLNSPTGLFAWYLSATLLSNLEAHEELYTSLQASIINNAPNWLQVNSIRGSAIRSWIAMLSTLAVLGVNPQNATQYIKTNRIIQGILNESSLYIDVKPIYTSNLQEPLVEQAPEQQLPPYKDLSITDIVPENTSTPLYKYGLRIHRATDIYLSTINLTKFRAEFIRRMHSDAILTASVTVVGNPRYKIGTTVLVTSQEINETRDNFITEGLKKTYHEVLPAEEYLKLFMSTNTVRLEAGGEYSNLFGTYAISEEGLKTHFAQALDVILGHSNGRPVPITAYIPTYGIYSVTIPEVQEYIRLLVKLHMPETYADLSQVKIIQNRLVSLVKDITERLFGDDTILNRNKVLQYLAPQRYHATQYYIQAIQHNWSMGAFYTTTLTLDYGQPVMLVTADNNEILGYLLTKSPAMLYSIQGYENEVIVKDNPLYISLVNQARITESFYKDSNRYHAAISLDRVKTKLKQQFENIITKERDYAKAALDQTN